MIVEHMNTKTIILSFISFYGFYRFKYGENLKKQSNWAMIALFQINVVNGDSLFQWKPRTTTKLLSMF